MSAAEQAAESQDTGLVMPDFSDVKDRVEPGTYKVRIVDSSVGKWEAKEEGKKDTYYINWTLETFQEAEEKNNGRKIFHKTPINGGGAFRLQDLYLAAMGEKCPTEKGFDRVMLHGRELEVIVVDGKDKQGQPTGYTEVKTVKALKAQH